MQETLTALIAAYGIFITIYCLFLVSKVHKYKQLYLGSVDSIQRAVNSFNQIIDVQDKMFNSLNKVIEDIKNLEKEFTPGPQVVNKEQIVEQSLYDQILSHLTRIDKGWVKTLTPIRKEQLYVLLTNIKNEDEDEQVRIIDLIADYESAVNTKTLSNILKRIENGRAKDSE